MDENKKENEKLPIEKKDGEITEPADLAFKWDYILETPKEEKQEKKEEKEKKHSSSGLLIICVLLLAAFAFYAVHSVKNDMGDLPVIEDVEFHDSTETEGGSKTIYVKDLSTAEGVLTPQEIYTGAIDSVVSIRATAKGKEGIGTGFVYRKDGYIATVHHVIDGMDKISVIFPSGKEYEAHVVASDELCDLAIIKIDAPELTPVSFGDSSSLLVGEELVAIGTPASIEFAGTMTRGDVSYNNRVVYVYDETSGSLKKKMTLIQTSAALNPGNSGGPVFDVYGKVVGIVTMKLGAGFDGIGFAIPIDTAAPVLDDMIKGVTPSSDKLSLVARHAAKIGIAGQNFSGDVGGKTLLGVSIAEFEPKDCDAAQKLRRGDVIVSLNGNAVADTSTLAKALCNFDPGDTVTITVYRAGQLLSFSVKLIK